MMEQYGESMIPAIQKTDDADDVIRLVKEYPDSAEDVLEAISKYGDDAVEQLGKGESLEEVRKVLEGGSRLSYEEFRKLSVDEQIKLFSQMSSKQIYELVKNSSDSWIVETYDLITSNNAKKFIKITRNLSGEIAFNLDWPKYGGYDPNTISSIGDLSGKVPVSRDGGDAGYTMGLGKNPDGTYANNSQRAIPKSSAEVNTGTFNVDLYKLTVDIVIDEGSDFTKISKLIEIGINEDIADDLLKDYRNWLTRPEIVGENNILEGVESVGKKVNSKYGYYGNAAEWNVAEIKMCGGAGQMNTVYSWGTLKEAGIITDIGKAVIN